MKVRSHQAFDDDTFWSLVIRPSELLDLLWVPHAVVNSSGHSLGNHFVIIYRDRPIDKSGTHFLDHYGLAIPKGSYCASGIDEKYLIMIDGVGTDLRAPVKFHCTSNKIVFRPAQPRAKYGSIHLELGTSKINIAQFLHSLITSRSKFLSALASFQLEEQTFTDGSWRPVAHARPIMPTLTLSTEITIFYEGSQEESMGCATGKYREVQNPNGSFAFEITMLGTKTN
jgi:hypothetical protein